MKENPCSHCKDKIRYLKWPVVTINISGITFLILHIYSSVYLKTDFIKDWGLIIFIIVFIVCFKYLDFEIVNSNNLWC